MESYGPVSEVDPALVETVSTTAYGLIYLWIFIFALMAVVSYMRYSQSKKESKEHRIQLAISIISFFAGLAGFVMWMAIGVIPHLS